MSSLFTYRLTEVSLNPIALVPNGGGHGPQRLIAYKLRAIKSLLFGLTFKVFPSNTPLLFIYF
jgi:hypothetical protein